jgi:sec-independent protein translocase protein TatC
MALVPFPQKSLKEPDPDWEDSDLESSEGGKMSFLEHLDELRKRIIWSVLSVAIGFLVAWFYRDPIYNFVMGPIGQLLKPGETLTYIDPTEAFSLNLKLAAIGGLLLALPVVMSQVWLFVAPGLYANEKKFAIPFVVLSSLCFVAGCWFSHKVLFPMSWQFLASFSNETLRFTPRIESTFGFYMKLLLACGLIFQMPPVVLILARLGIVTARFLLKNFKYALLIIFVTAAIITPDGNPVTQTVMAGPMIVLYLFSIGLAWLVGKRRRNADADVDA